MAAQRHLGRKVLDLIAHWRGDPRFWQVAVQVLVVLLVAIAASLLWGNLDRNLQQLRIPLGLDFLNSQASFDIGEKAIAYTPADPYWRALLVGLLNTLKVAIAGIILATTVGMAAGVARLSDNWLARHLALVYVEAFRNSPLLVQLLFWYLAVFLNLTKLKEPVRWWGWLEVSNNGLDALGIKLSPEFTALIAGLTFYTGAFIAEIVRAGIQSVPRGQWEAARSLGLGSSTILRLIIFPQAWRVMIPPLTSQYLNLAKNSSLASAVGYPDLYFVASTTFNQTGKAVEVMLLLTITYLVISLIIALIANIFNRIVQIPER